MPKYRYTGAHGEVVVPFTVHGPRVVSEGDVIELADGAEVPAELFEAAPDDTPVTESTGAGRVDGPDGAVAAPGAVPDGSSGGTPGEAVGEPAQVEEQVADVDQKVSD